MSQQVPESNVNEMRDGLPVIQMEESSRTLDILLRFLHPNCPATLESLDTIDDIMCNVEMGSGGTASTHNNGEAAHSSLHDCPSTWILR
jgi:hypothetical protein